MNEETPNPPSRDEARASLAAIEATRTETSRNIAGSLKGPNFIWLGIFWIIIFGYAQFPFGPPWLLCVLALIGFAGLALVKKIRPSAIKRAPSWRAVASWLVIFLYAGLFLVLLEPWDLLKNLSPEGMVMAARKFAAYALLVSMFGYVLMGISVSRFYVGLGLLMTALILVGYYCVPAWFCLWVGVVGGGTFILSGLFIRKFWK